MLELIFGLLILGIVVYIAMRVFHSVVIGVILIFLVFIASYLILGSFPSLKSVPIIGQYLPRTTGDVIAVIKDVLHSIDVIGISRDAENNLLTIVANTGKNEVSNFRVFVDEEGVRIINNPKDPLESGQITTIQLDWKNNFSKIIIQTDETNVSYSVS